jgi:hypothetical protein
MSNFKPSPYQQGIYDFIQTGQGNAVVSAVAGSGKTTTLINALHLIPNELSVLFLAFNKSIAQELSERVPKDKTNIEVRTLHAYGYLSVKKSHKSEIDNSKYKKLLKDILSYSESTDLEYLKKYDFKPQQIQMVDDFIFQDSEKELIEDKVAYFNRVQKLCDLGRLDLIDLKNQDLGIEQLKELSQKHSVEIINGECFRAWLLINLGANYLGKADFSDMVFLPNHLNLQTQKYDIVFIDECFPYHTYISTEKGKMKIGHLEKMMSKKEDLPNVISFNEKTKCFENKRIKRVWCNGYKDVYEITLGGKRKIKATKNHKFLTIKGWVKMKDLKIGDAILSNYTEQPYHSVFKGDKLDIILGTCIGDSNIDEMSNNIYRIRCVHGEKQEEYIKWKANLLNAKISEISENGYSSKKAFRFNTKGFYFDGLTKINAIKNLTKKSLSVLFMDDGHLSKNGLTMTIHALAEYPDLVLELKNVLKTKFNIDSSFCNSKSSSTNKVNYFLRLNKINIEKLSLLISPYIHPSMDYKVLNKHRKFCDLKNWNNIYDNKFGCMTVTKEMLLIGSKKVYDMEVEDNHNFIITSNTFVNSKAKDFGFIAHNCQDLNACQRELMKKAIKPETGRFIAVGDLAQAIYGFAGSDSDSFQKLIDIPNTITLPLSVCYRCGSDIIEYVKKLMPTIEASPSAKKGLIDFDFSYKNIIKGDMVICRNTMPLVALCMRYLKQGTKAFVMGTDISASLITMVDSCRRKTEEFNCANIFARIYNEKNKLVKNIMSKENCSENEANENQIVVSFMDKVSTLEIISNGCITGDDLIDKLKVIFSDNSDGICLSTIHKSKGLEADRVFIIHEELMPSKHAKKDWEKLQEKNLMYVAYTRAKSLLGFVTDFDAYSDHESKQNDIVIKEGGFVGVVNEELKIKLSIVMVTEKPNKFGNKPNYLYEMVDEKGNLFVKWGIISERFLISNHAEVEIGSIVEFHTKITEHKDFRGTKTNVIGRISK